MPHPDDSPALFDDLPPGGRRPREQPDPNAPVRVISPERSQVEFHLAALDELLPDEHHARMAWAMACGLDLDPLYSAIRSRGDNAGRPAIDPQLLFALWLYATLDGVGSGRKLARLCESELAYKWLCGGVSVGYHTLSDFRVEHGAFLDQALSTVVKRLLDQGLVSLDRVAHDGIKVRASAGASSFHRRETLDKHQRAARELVETLKGEIDEQTGPDRSQAARLRAAQERDRRVQAALDAMPEAEERKAKMLAKKSRKVPENESEEERQAREKRDGARVSSTDPEAQNMKMADGGFRPA